MKLAISMLSSAFLLLGGGMPAPASAQLDFLGDAHIRMGRSLKATTINAGIQYALQNNIAHWQEMLIEVDSTSHRLLQETQGANQTTAEGLAAHMYWKTKTGMNTMVDVLTKASEIELYQNDGDQPNQDFLDLLAEAKKEIQKYQLALVHNLARMSELETNSFDKEKIAKLQSDAQLLFSDLLAQLVTVSEAEMVVSAGQDDMQVIQDFQASMDSTFAHILQVLDDLAPTIGTHRNLGDASGKACETTQDCKDHGCTNDGCYCRDSGSLAGTCYDSCFSSESTVEVLGKGTVTMVNLEVGDKILTRGGQYEPVYAFGHLKADKQAVFRQIYTKQSEEKKNPLEATSNHHIFVHTAEGKQKAVPAGTLKVGDILYGADGTHETITKITSVTRDGIYAPLTPSGTIVVDGIEASTYVNLFTRGGVGSIKTLYVSEDQVAHIFLAPFRMLCLGVSPILGKVGHNEEGMIWFVELGYKFWATPYNKRGTLAAIVPFTVGTALWFPLYAVELVFGPALGPLAMLAGALFVLFAKKSGLNIVPAANQKVKQL